MGHTLWYAHFWEHPHHIRFALCFHELKCISGWLWSIFVLFFWLDCVRNYHLVSQLPFCLSFASRKLPIIMSYLNTCSTHQTSVSQLNYIFMTSINRMGKMQSIAHSVRNSTILLTILSIYCHTYCVMYESLNDLCDLN